MLQVCSVHSTSCILSAVFLFEIWNSVHGLFIAWWLFAQIYHPSHFLFVNCPLKRPLPAFFVRVNTRSSIAFDKSFFFFFFFPDDEEPRRNVVPSSQCENAVCLALSHLRGSFTPGSQTDTKGRHCFSLCFLLMATCCFLKDPIITSEWSFCEIWQDQRDLLCLLCDWCKQNPFSQCAWTDLTKSFFPVALTDQWTQTCLLICISRTEGCVFVFLSNTSTLWFKLLCGLHNMFSNLLTFCGLEEIPVLQIVTQVSLELLKHSHITTIL